MSRNAGKGDNAVIVAFISQKGGVGKTTAAVSVAAAYAEAGIPAGVIDADPQGSAAAWGRAGEALGHGPGWLVGSVAPLKVATLGRLRSTVELLERAGARRIAIDCPPSFSDAALVAAAVADVAVVPCGPSPLDLIAAARAVDLIGAAQAERGGRPKVMLLPTLAGASRGSRDTAAALADLGGRGAKVLPAMTRRDLYLAAVAAGRTVIELQPAGPAAREVRDIMQSIERGRR